MNIAQMGYSIETRRKAEKVLANHLVQTDADVSTIWWVRSERDPEQVYRVQCDLDLITGQFTWVTCTCPHGLHKGGGRTTCYHSMAALLFALHSEKWLPTSLDLET